MFKFLKLNNHKIVAPVKGMCIPLEEVPDQVFAKKIMGDGFAIIPSSEEIVSPVDAKIIMIPTSKHAIGLKTKDGIEILIHIGIDTVNLNGEGFQVLKSAGEKVKAGEKLIRFDSVFMDQKNMNMTTMLIFTNGYNQAVHLNCYGREVSAGEVLMD